MSLKSKLWLVNSILASCVQTFHSPYGPQNDNVVHILGCAEVISLWREWFITALQLLGVT